MEKIPYQNISVMPGTTFESLDPKGELKCQDSGTVVDGKNVITCTGKQLWTYELKFTNSACPRMLLRLELVNVRMAWGMTPRRIVAPLLLLLTLAL